MSEWKKKLNYGEPTHIEHKVGDGVLRFYPVSVGMMFKLRKATKSVAKSIAVLTSSGSRDTGNIFREVGDVLKDEKGQIIKVGDRVVRDTETIAEAISPALAELRTRERTEAVESLLSALTDPESLETIADIILDSLRLPPNERPPATEFIRETPLPLFTQFIVGVCKANKDVFGPLTGKLSPIFTRARAVVEGKLSEAEAAANEATSKPNQTSPEMQN